MTLKEWERDVINRQRNIVFPDTILNEGRLYRNIASGKAIFTLGQKISLVLTLAFFICVNAVDFAHSFSWLIAQNRFRKMDLWRPLGSFIWLLFWIFLAVTSLFPIERKRIVRRGLSLEAIQRTLVWKSSFRWQDFNHRLPSKGIDHGQQRRRQQHSPEGNDDAQNDWSK